MKYVSYLKTKFSNGNHLKPITFWICSRCRRRGKHLFPISTTNGLIEYNGDRTQLLYLPKTFNIITESECCKLKTIHKTFCLNNWLMKSNLTIIMYLDTRFSISFNSNEKDKWWNAFCFNGDVEIYRTILKRVQSTSVYKR